jgi:hypothetical protein
MKHRLLVSCGAALTACAVVAAGQNAVAKPASKPAPAVKKWTMPHTADGQPDLQGVWTNSTLTPLERPADLANKSHFASQQEADTWAKNQFANITGDRRDGGAQADVGRSYNEFWRDRGSAAVATLRTSLVIDPADGRVPALTATGAKRQADQRDYQRAHPADGPEDRSLWERCLTRGLPIVPGPYNNDFQIVQAPGYVAILHEMIHDVRIIPLDKPTEPRPHVPATIRQWLGDPRGHWEGDTLVIESSNFSEKTNFRGSSEGMYLVERLTRVDADTISYQFTVDDPGTFERPFSGEVPMNKTPDQVFEYACNEGNYALRGILGAVREDEAKAAAKGLK